MLLKCCHKTVYSCNIYLPSAYDVTSTIPGTRDKAANRTVSILKLTYTLIDNKNKYLIFRVAVMLLKKKTKADRGQKVGKEMLFSIRCSTYCYNINILTNLLLRKI